MSTTETSAPVELAYRVPGKGWKRKTLPTPAAAERFVDRLLVAEGDDVEVRWAQ